MARSWMRETGKEVPEPIFEMEKVLRTLLDIYDKITIILEELLCGCYFDNVESIVEVILTKHYYFEQQVYNYCKRLVKLCEKFENEYNKFKNICKEVIKGSFFRD